ncbi:SgcJ/EcaC family oxidoreductase [Dactylosporangium salmoneum]|uniref:DUF4440 domain-containing protein n=1 Tax=Dactylosporangium salmoneum TaxID=53361 RepID=A0ABN3I4U8_9ACTN
MHTIDQTEVRDLMSRMAAAWEANDPDALAALYTEDAGVVTAGTHAQGRDAIRAFMTAGFAGPLKDTTLSEDFERIRYVGQDIAIVNGVGGLVLPGEDTVQTGLRRRSTWVLARTGEGWLVEAFHNCPAGG